MSFVTTFSSTSRTEATSIDELAARLGGPRSTLLAVWAHPDDESYLAGGLMAAFSRMGGRVVNVTATLGEHGTHEPERFGPARLAGIRRLELARAVERLGANETIVLGYEDGTCAAEDDDRAANRIARIIRRIGPDAIVGFGPDGVTGHSDHRTLARWTEMAVRMCGDSIPLLTSASARLWPPDVIERMHEANAFYPGYPDLAQRAPVVATTVAGSCLERKLAALAEHRSQVGPLLDALGGPGYRRMASIEGYCLANYAAERAVSPHFAAAA
jgi:LmbE family N-acetylglucosaminyl deacetylase